MSDDSPELPSGDLVQSLIRGLTVIQAFGTDRRPMSMTEIATIANLSKPSARRFLLTLQSLGYVRKEGDKFRLLPKVLDLGLAFFSSLELPEIVEPYLDALNAQVREACSVGIRDGDSVVLIARSQWQRVRATTLVRVGTRMDPLATALGRVLIAALPPDEIDEFLLTHEPVAYTEHTIIDRKRLKAEILDIAEKGWALADQEVELGMRTLAAPIRDVSGRVVAGLNVAANYMRVPLPQLTSEVLPLLLDTTRQIDAELAALGRTIPLA